MVQPNRQQLLLKALIETFERLGMTVRFEELGIEDIKGRGGRCRVKGDEMIILDRNLEPREKIDLLVRELARTQCDGIYLPPNVRDAVENAGEEDK